MSLRVGMTDSRYRGRFAPSPTGDLHIGSLIAAVGSYLAAYSQQGEWWVRIEDIDPPREVWGATDRILRILDAFGFEWDQLQFQHERLGYYEEIMAHLRANHWVYPCTCSRKTLSGSDNQRYSGHCRNRRIAPTGQIAWRILTTGAVIDFHDHLQGPFTYRFDEVIGDFVLQRADGFFAYQLAVGVDDAEQGMTDVVRGVDLLDSTPRQIFIQQKLGLATPRYYHLPVIVNHLGQKLSKQTHAEPLTTAKAVPQLWTALQYLGQQPPHLLLKENLREIWDWAKTHWNIKLIPSCREILVEDFTTQADKS